MRLKQSRAAERFLLKLRFTRLPMAPTSGELEHEVLTERFTSRAGACQMSRA